MALIPETYIVEFDEQVKHLAQVKQFVFAGATEVDSFIGERKTYNRLAGGAGTLISARVQNTNIATEDFSKRSVFPSAYEKAFLIDEFDTYYSNVNFLTPFAENIVNALNANKNAVLINALLGNAFSGKDGLTPVALPGGQTIDEDFDTPTINSGLTLAKIIEAARLLDDANFLYGEERYMIVSPAAMNGLLKNVEKASSTDFVNVKALVSGQIDEFYGFKFIKSTQLPIGTGIRSCIAYVKPAAMFATIKDIATDVRIRGDKSNAVQVRGTLSVGATRLEDTGVVEILVDETV